MIVGDCRATLIDRDTAAGISFVPLWWLPASISSVKWTRWFLSWIHWHDRPWRQSCWQWFLLPYVRYITISDLSAAISRFRCLTDVRIPQVSVLCWHWCGQSRKLMFSRWNHSDLLLSLLEHKTYFWSGVRHLACVCSVGRCRRCRRLSILILLGWSTSKTHTYCLRNIVLVHGGTRDRPIVPPIWLPPSCVSRV